MAPLRLTAAQFSEARWVWVIALASVGCGVSSLDPVRREVFVSTTELDFGEVYLGSTAQLALEVSNGGRSAHLVELSLALPFETSKQLEVPGGSSAPLTISFTPLEPGAFSAPLVIGAQTVTVRGTGLAIPQCEVPPNGCITSSFDLTARQCLESPRPDGATCTTRCVPSGLCSLGVCAGVFASCDDSNPCTDDACSETQGCVHTPAQCPADPDNPCRVGLCDPQRGCTFTEARDGTICGAKNCQTNTVPVCIASQCVERPLPTPECLQQFAYLKASTPQAGASFGNRVSLSADGSTLAVGASAANTVSVFRRMGNTWGHEATLTASNTAGGDFFGYALSLSADGDTLAVGAHLEDSQGNAADLGAVHLFVRTGSSWTEEPVLSASDASPGAAFGASVALSSSGERLVVGATGVSSGAGAVYSFQRAGGAWLETAKLVASNAQPGDLFGFSVALSEDGSTVAVGALGEDSRATGVNGTQTDETAPQSGAVYLFRGATQVAYLKASNTGAADVFGISVSLSRDGKLLAVGAYGEDSSVTGINGNQSGNFASQSGAVYVFREAGAWTQEAFVKPSNTQLGGNFGYSVALSGDGLALAVGAWSENSGSTGIDGHQFNASAPDSGAVYLFRKKNGAWAQDAYVKASNTEAADLFGHSVALDSDASTLACSAIGEDSSTPTNQLDNAAADSGAVYVFSLQ